MLEALAPTHNQPEYSVSELANAVKRTVEEAFGYVRVRGEISGCKRASSGHLYLDLKDTNALINAVCWKGVLGKLDITPENGMEVICTGRLSTYAGRSSYQLVVERIEIAGAGALMALLEKRKATLAAEGLFASERKLPLPYIPRVIGVVTSPTGAVIRDILHRIADRFPAHVLVWGVAVQGKGADAQVAEAIAGFNAFDGIITPPRPDLLIVARGGGSMEDLWTFNEEVVVRASASSTIPLISAVGHETDTTLIDYASSVRAPTPTAAAEMAVPVLSDLREGLAMQGQRLTRAITRKHQEYGQRIEGLARGLIHPEKMLEARIQRADEWGERLNGAIQQRLNVRMERFNAMMERFSPLRLMQQVEVKAERLQQIDGRLQQAFGVRLERSATRLEAAGRMLEILSHQSALQRGFAYVTGQGGALIASVKDVTSTPMTLHFHDGEVVVSTQHPAPAPKKKAPTLPPASQKQHQLL
jgi:exodeoxyribonuclease VII large subunit